MNDQRPDLPYPGPYAYGSNTPGPYPVPSQPPAPRPKRTGLKILAVLGAIAVATVGGCTALLYSGAQSAIDNTPATIDPGTPTPTIHATAGPKKVAPSYLPRDGVLLVGKDVKAGTFRATVPQSDLGASLPSCYVARLRGTSGDLGDIITNQNRYPGDVVTLTIKASDAAVEIHGCGKWVRIK